MGTVAFLVLGGLLIAEPMESAEFGAAEPAPSAMPAPPALPAEPNAEPSAPASDSAPADESVSDPWTAVPVQSIVDAPPAPSPIESGQLLDPWAPRRRGRIARSVEGDLRNPFEHDVAPPVRGEPIARAELRDPFAGRDMRLPAPHLRGPVPTPGPVELRDPFDRGESAEPTSAPCAPPLEPGQAAPPSTARCPVAPSLPAPDA